MARIDWFRFHSDSVVSSIGAARGDAGVGDHDVKSAESVDGRCERVADVGFGGDIASHRNTRVAQILHSILRPVTVEIEGQDAGPGARQRIDDCPPDPACRPGDKDNLALQLATRRRERQLVKLERPILDRETLRRRQRG